MEDITKTKHMSFKEVAAYSLGLFGFQAIVGPVSYTHLVSYQIVNNTIYCI